MVYTESITVIAVQIQKVVRDLERISKPCNAIKCHKRLGKLLCWPSPAVQLASSTVLLSTHIKNET